MFDNNDKKGGQAGSDDKSNSTVTDYLQAPRKKRKNYIILAVQDGFNQDLVDDIDNFIRHNFNYLALSKPKNAKELTRQFNRIINLLIISDEFVEPQAVMDLVSGLKKRRSNELIPVLFLTRRPEELVKLYHTNLLSFHESDDYIYYPKTDSRIVLSQIRNGIENRNSRRSRRYRIDIAAKLFHLNTGETIDTQILDLSVHGAMLQGQQDFVFQEGDQLLIRIPCSEYLSIKNIGDYLKISAKVRRVFISGNKVAVSFEHMSEKQIKTITDFITHLVSRDMKRSTNKLKGNLQRKAAE